MKATGIIRRVDDLGRIVIPREIRQTTRIKEGASLEILLDEDGSIVLKKVNMERNIKDDIDNLDDTISFFSESFDEKELCRIKRALEEIRSYIKS